MSENNRSKCKELTISNNYIFCRVMQDEEMCKELIEVLLGEKIGEIKSIETQKTIKIDNESKGITLDLIVKDDSTIYNIEMQREKSENLVKKIRCHESVIDANEINKGVYYKELKKMVVIFICTFDPLGKGYANYEFGLFCESDKELEFQKNIREVLFNTKAYKEVENDNLRALLRYIEDNTNEENNQFVSKIENKVNEMKIKQEKKCAENKK